MVIGATVVVGTTVVTGATVEVVLTGAAVVLVGATVVVEVEQPLRAKETVVMATAKRISKTEN